MKPEFIDTGQFRPFGKPIPEPVSLKIGPFPVDPPALVRFTIPEAGPDPSSMPPSPQAAMARIHWLSRHRCQMHFGETFLVSPDGALSGAPEPYSVALPAISLDIDFAYLHTEMASTKLPPDRTPIEELKSGFSHDPWRLVLSSKEHPEWHDFIMFHKGRFVILSIALEAEKLQETKS